MSFRLVFLRRQEALVRNLKDVKVVFDSAGIRYWLDYGTLLGAVREGRALEWDDDLDLGILSNSWNKTVRTISELQNRGFCGGSTELRIHGELFFRRIWLLRYGLYADIFVYEVAGENARCFSLTRRKNRYLASTKRRLSDAFRWAYLMLNDTIYYTPHPSNYEYKLNCVFKVVGSILTLIPLQARIKFAGVVWQIGRSAGIRFVQFVTPAHFFEKLGTARICGIAFNTPSNVEQYLRYHYGDWRIPVKEWDWTKDDGAIAGYL